MWFARTVLLALKHINHVWPYDFVSAKTHDGRTVRMLNLIDEHIRESLLMHPERRWSSAKVIEALRGYRYAFPNSPCPICSYLVAPKAALH